jgi:hypothetical protein
MMASFKPTSLILVAVMTEPRDLEIARLLGWYRIPLRSAPKVIGVDYLAFYQSGGFGEAGGCIKYVSAVRGHELVTRDELFQNEPDHPRAKEEYYKVQIGPLELLDCPILAGKWRRITFLYTTGEYLVNATTINDLVVHTEERQLLWKSLRERFNRLPGYRIEEYPDLDIDPEVLAVLLGIKEVDETYG